MFVPIWLVFLAFGIVMAVFTLIWSVKSNQFDDQDRARYLPLIGMTAEQLSEKPKTNGWPTVVAMVIVMLSGALVLAFTLATVVSNA